MVDPAGGQLVSMCKPGMPCKEFNKFLANGSLVESARDCGFAEHLLQAVLSKDFIQTGAEGLRMQKSSTGMTDNCYCTLKNGTGVRGPVYGPIYYANAKLIYLLGGLELLGLMPGCRVLCADGCNSHCQPT